MSKATPVPPHTKGSGRKGTEWKKRNRNTWCGNARLQPSPGGFIN